MSRGDPVKVEVVNNSDLFETAPTVKSPEVIKIQTEKPADERIYTGAESIWKTGGRIPAG